jgi:hypothetical protein
LITRSHYILTLVALAGLLLSACGSSAPGELTVGAKAPAFTLSTSTGGTVSLADYQGKQPVLLYFHMAVG